MNVQRRGWFKRLHHVGVSEIVEAVDSTTCPNYLIMNKYAGLPTAF
jgi:hypothetical protein